jgi:hypothetical protein
MIRSHAAWALGRSLGIGAAPILRSALEAETAPETREELSLALLMVENRSTHRTVLAADEWARGNDPIRGVALVVDDLGRPGDGVVLHLIGDGFPGPPTGGGPVPIEVHANARDMGERAATDADVVRVYDPDHALRSWGRRVGSGASLQV